MARPDPFGETQRRARYYRDGHWRDEDLWTSIAAVAAVRGEAVAFKQDERAIGFAAFADLAQRVGAGLAARGIAAGDPVVIHARNGIEAAAALAGCAWLGAVAVPLPPMFTGSQVEAVCTSSGAKAMFCLGKTAEVERAVAAAQACGVTLIVVPDEQPKIVGSVPWHAILGQPGLARSPRNPDDLALLVYSSGTTAAPKGVMHSANTVRYAALARAQLHGVTADDICLLVCQFGFVGGIIFGMLTAMLTGATTVILPSWDADEALRTIARERISYGLFMPTHTHDLLSAPTLGTVDVSSLRHAAMGGITEQQRQEVLERLCPLPFPGYGMSECLGHATCSADSPTAKLLASEGRAYPGTEIIVVDGDAARLPPHMAGSLMVRGPSRCLGYFAAPELTEAAFTADGFFRSGDICMLDEDGYVTFVGREKDIIRRGGVTIVPTEIESALRRHPLVREVAVVGLPDERLGERTCACLILADGAELSLDDVTAFLERQGVARYMWPEEIRRRTDFPRTPSLKIMKPALVAQLCEGTADAA